MKRGLESIEISDDEWSNHDFDSSRILHNKPSSSSSSPKSKTLPPIESFAFSSKTDNNSYLSDNSCSSSSDDCVEIVKESLEDDDFAEAPTTTVSSRGRRFVIDDDDEDDDMPPVENDHNHVGFAEEEEEDFDDDDDDDDDDVEVLKDDENDVVGKALQKCSKISAQLRSELYGSTNAGAACDRYAQVDDGSSSVRIVTHDDICEACGSTDGVLKPYQLVGVNFLMLLYRKKVAGAILADEMGLGKTIQAITYLSLLNHLENDPGPHLIVCPASVLENWERELRKWCPSFTVLQFHGAGRAAHSKQLNSLSKSRMPPPFNVILVCYSLFERHRSHKCSTAEPVLLYHRGAFRMLS